MKGRLLAVGVGAAGMLMLAMPAHAHHGGGGSDQAETRTFAATVTALQFVSPHVVLFFDVTTDGTTEQWSGWLRAPGALARAGWTRHTLEPGDRITVQGRSERGSRFLQIRKLVDGDGRPIPLSRSALHGALHCVLHGALHALIRSGARLARRSEAQSGAVGASQIAAHRR
ncbi:MAG: DUF6152 family protein [Acidobacteria bacterium]|nr:DUF6152 family protein [Chloroflexota bacterium]MDA1185198.1 DUF6152 family protein [Acidobacteriota bacterium]